jgi:flagellar protein FlbD
VTRIRLEFGANLPTEEMDRTTPSTLTTLDGAMIVVTRLHGSVLALNCDLIERIEATPRTILTMVDGSRYVVRESVAEIVDKVRAFRASVIVLAHEQERERLLLGDGGGGSELPAP